ncbi:MAG: ESPR domain-containing protein [Dialister sp.]
MNKIYKLVWSKVRNTWVVTSEIAKGHGKNSSSGSKRKSLKIAVMAAFLGGVVCLHRYVVCICGTSDRDEFDCGRRGCYCHR